MRAVLVLILMLATGCIGSRAPVSVLEIWNAKPICIDQSANVDVEVAPEERTGATRVPTGMTLKSDSMKFELQAPSFRFARVDRRQLNAYIEEHPRSVKSLESETLLWVNAAVRSHRAERSGADRDTSLEPGNGVESLIVEDKNLREPDQPNDAIELFAMCTRRSSGQVECRRQLAYRGALWTYRFSPDGSILEQDENHRAKIERIVRPCP